MYLPAIEGHVPVDMVRTFRAFLEFCYLVRRDIIDEATLDQMENALERFHRYREIFRTEGVRLDGFNLPRQHSMVHYRLLVELFGAPNGLCSSITESKHIKAVKEPWRRSNKNAPLGQMLLTNQRLDKLAASRVDFARRGMLEGTALTDAMERLAAQVLLQHQGEQSAESDTDDGSEAAASDAIHGPANGDGAAIASDEVDELEPEPEAEEAEGAVGGPTVENEVVLARTPGAS